MRTDARVKANAVDNVLRIQSLHFRIGIQFIEVRHTECKVCIGKQLDRFCFGKAHKQSVNILFNCALLQKLCKSLCCCVQSFASIC